MAAKKSTTTAKKPAAKKKPVSVDQLVADAERLEHELQTVIDEAQKAGGWSPEQADHARDLAGQAAAARAQLEQAPAANAARFL